MLNISCRTPFHKRTHRIPFFIFSLFLFFPVTKTQAYSPSTATSNKSLCKVVQVYRICADTAFYKRQILRLRPILNFREAERVAHNQITDSLKKIDPNVIIQKQNSSDYIDKKWKRLTKNQTKTFSNEISSLANNKTIKKSLNPFDFAIIEAAKKKRIFISVELNKFPNFLKVHKKKTSQFCNDFINSYDNIRSYSPSRLKREREGCHTHVTGNLEKAWRLNDPRAIRGVFFTMVSFWANQLILDKFEAFLNANPRAVYIIKSSKRLSPRINSMGNLYMPAKLLKKSSRRDIDLIMLHEASHIRFFNFERLTKLFFSNIPQFLKISNKNTSNPADKLNSDLAIKATRKLLYVHGQMMEMNVDAHVLKEIFYNKLKRYRYQQLIGEIETLYPERAEAIELLNKLADTIDEPILLEMIPQILSQRQRASQVVFTTQQLKIAKRYLKVTTDYISALMAANMSDLDQGNKQKRIDPMEFEEQAVKAYSRILRKFHDQMEN